MTYKAGNVLIDIPRAQKCPKTRFLGGVVWVRNLPYKSMFAADSNVTRVLLNELLALMPGVLCTCTGVSPFNRKTKKTKYILG